MVTKVNEKDISAKTKGGEVSSIPYGMIVWSTSIGTRPVIKDFMKHINQEDLLKEAESDDGSKKNPEGPFRMRGEGRIRI
ncbi:hypothetical protein Bca101_003200 [Brassica carinata]